MTSTALGGFCENYRGYGGEDTDFGTTAQRFGIGLWWIGGAHAYHQHHPVGARTPIASDNRRRDQR